MFQNKASTKEGFHRALTRKILHKNIKGIFFDFRKQLYYVTLPAGLANSLSNNNKEIIAGSSASQVRLFNMTLNKNEYQVKNDSQHFLIHTHSGPMKILSEGE